jgi:branched-chain amino acid transport system permease protein
LTLIFSVMGVLNFAHASFYMLGAYAAFTLGQTTGFWVALFLAPVVVGLVGAAVERWGLRPVHKNGHLAELLFTFGLAYLIEEVVRIVWGRLPVAYEVPDSLDFPLFTLFGAQYSAYRIFMLAVSIAMLAALWVLLKRTRAGLIIQAALTHPHMVGHLGHDVPRLFMIVFGVGCGLAGLAGVIGGNILVTEPSMALSIGPIVFVVVVIGGMGSLEGAFVASLLIGLLQTFAVAIDTTFHDLFGWAGLSAVSDLGRISISSLAPMLPFLLLVLVLMIRPRGLMGEREF